MQNKDAVVLALFRAVEERDREALLESTTTTSSCTTRPRFPTEAPFAARPRCGSIGCGLRDDVAGDLGSVAAD